MLFLGHSAATAINSGKVMFTKNPLAINYPEWIAFASYSYRQLKWTMIKKPQLRDIYVRNEIREALDEVYRDIDNSFEVVKDRIITF